MTDENLSAEGLPSDGSAGEVSQPSQDVSSEHVNTQAATDQEKLFTQSELNNMQGTVRRKSYDKGYEAGISQNQSGTQSQHGAANEGGSAASLDESKVRELINSQIAEVSRQYQADAEDRRVKDYANNIYRSIDANAEACLAKDDIPGFKASMDRVNGFAQFPAVLDVAHTLDNSAEVLRHLSSDEGIDKLAGMAILSRDAVAERLKKISDRLKQNDNAKKSPSAPNPISQIDTNVRDGIGGSEPDSIADFKEIYTG